MAAGCCGPRRGPPFGTSWAAVMPFWGICSLLAGPIRVCLCHGRFFSLDLHGSWPRIWTGDPAIGGAC